MKISIRRAYEEAGPGDGYRVLVDRVWPRGRTRADLALAEWAKELGPSTALRRWFGHDPRRWEAFRERYRKELAAAAQRAVAAGARRRGQGTAHPGVRREGRGAQPGGRPAR